MKRDSRIYSIGAEEIVDLRLKKGKSWDEIALLYRDKLQWPELTKMMLYTYYTEVLSTSNYNNYEPIPIGELIRWLRNPYMTIRDIASVYGVPETGLKNYMNDRNLKRTINVRAVRRMLAEGYSVNRIAKYYGTNIHTLRKWIHNNGLSNEAPRNNTRTKQININLHFRIDAREKEREKEKEKEE